MSDMQEKVLIYISAFSFANNLQIVLMLYKQRIKLYDLIVNKYKFGIILATILNIKIYLTYFFLKI